MPSLLDPEARRAILDRVDRLTPQCERRWGRIEVDKLLCHLADQLRMALGVLKTDPPSGPMRFAPMRYLLIHVVPWPRGKIVGPPVAFTTQPVDWDNDHSKLRGLIDRFGKTAPGDLAPTNPIFGNMKPRDWGVLGYRHLDHHLKQFGV